MTKKQYLLDTNILMSTESYSKLFTDYANCELIIHPKVIEELDHLKAKETRPGAAYQARRAIKAIRKYHDHFTFIKDPNELDVEKVDNILLRFSDDNGFTLLTNDANVQLKAEHILGIDSEKYNQHKKTIQDGYIEISIAKDAYEEGSFEVPEMPYGQYLVIHTESESYVHKSLGMGEFEKVHDTNIGSYHLGTISPKDVYQRCAFNSLMEDDFTIITGTAGTGKTLMSLTYALREVQCGARNKLIIFSNPVKARGAEQLGFYTGSRTEKLLQNSVGAILISKLGGLEAVVQLMEEDKLEILPFSDIRGYEVSEDNIMYISEAQNLNVELLKLAIQRCAEGAKIILEGDPTTQVDHYSFEGDGNGLVRAIEVFEGFLGFSHVNLPNIYRSEIAERAELL